MSISRFYKVSIAGAQHDEDRILDQLQNFGRLHIISGQHGSSEETAATCQQHVLQRRGGGTWRSPSARRIARYRT